MSKKIAGLNRKGYTGYPVKTKKKPQSRRKRNMQSGNGKSSKHWKDCRKTGKE